MCNSCCRFAGRFAAVKLVESTPTTVAKTPSAVVHTTMLPSSSRNASAVGDERNRRRGSARSRAGSSPVPMSRRPAITPAATSSAAPASTGSARTAGRGAANARASSLQPNGVAQRTQPRKPRCRRSPAADTRARARRSRARGQSGAWGRAERRELRALQRRSPVTRSPLRGTRSRPGLAASAQNSRRAQARARPLRPRWRRARRGRQSHG